jgi:hypothetical protein
MVLAHGWPDDQRSPDPALIRLHSLRLPALQDRRVLRSQTQKLETTIIWLLPHT